MKNNIKFISFTFDFKVKILIAICCIIASIIIVYSFYYICFKPHEKIKLLNSNIEDILDIDSYEAEYKITVNSNKNSNTYNVYEKVDLKESTYDMVIDNSIKINIDIEKTQIQKENNDLNYLQKTENNILKNNPISFSSVITCIRKIAKGDIEGKILKIEKDNKYIYEICMNENYIEKVKKLEIVAQKDNCKLIEIKMYNSEEKELYSVTFDSFIAKK